MRGGSFAVERRVFIDTDGNKWGKRQWVNGLDPATVSILTGMMFFNVILMNYKMVYN